MRAIDGETPENEVTWPVEGRCFEDYITDGYGELTWLIRLRDGCASKYKTLSATLKAMKAAKRAGWTCRGWHLFQGTKNRQPVYHCMIDLYRPRVGPSVETEVRP